jgi:hypothetical protein
MRTGISKYVRKSTLSLCRFDPSLLSPRFHSHNNYFYFPFLSPSLFSLRLEGPVMELPILAFKKVGWWSQLQQQEKEQPCVYYYLIICRIIFKKGL